MKIFILLFLLFLNMFALDNSTKSLADKNLNEVKKDKVEFIKVSDVPEFASKVTLELKKIKELTTTTKELEDMMSSITPYLYSIKDLLNSKEYQNIKDANLRKLQKMRNELLIYKKQLQEWESILKKRIKLYEKNRIILKEYRNIWNETYNNAIKEKAPTSIKKNIQHVIYSIYTLDKNIKKKYDRALTNSQIITTKALIIQEKKSEFKKRELIIKNMIFYQNENTYFELLKESSFSFSKYIQSIKTTLNDKYNEIVGYVQTHTDSLIELFIIFTFFIFFILYNSYLYKKRRLFIREESYDKKEFFFIKHVFSTISIAFVLTNLIVYGDRPISFTDLLIIIMIIPVITILKTILDKKYYKYLYIFFIIVLLYYLDENSNNCYLEHRAVMLFINILLIVYTIYIFINKDMFKTKNVFYNKAFQSIVIIFTIALFVSFFANLYGSVLLSSRIIDYVINSVYASFMFYVFYMILTAYTIIILRKRISAALYTLEKYSYNIEKTIKLFIKIWMLSWWLISLTKLLGIHEYIVSIKNILLSTSWEVGKTVISIQAIVDFLFILFTTWVVAKLLKIVLEVEVFSRFKFPRGMPTAILTTLNYIIIISGSILAFSSLGVTTQQFALVIGALGVGIGFGLRNIIANFVSGIIMVFERPVQIGDTIEVENTMGDVQSIGARSSTIKTFDGAEVIIPNADFMAKEIINWTLSDKQRRKTIEFKVSLDNDVDKILSIMQEVAIGHKNVVKNPKPVPTFQGFGEYYLTFKLYFWLSDNIIEAQSEISIILYKKLKDSGVKLPIPKTELKR